LLSASQENNIGNILKSFPDITTLHSLCQLFAEHTQWDVWKYYLYGFCNIACQNHSEGSSSQWWTDDSLDLLVGYTDVLFIFAATAVKFISNPQHKPKQRFARLIDSLASNSNLGLLDALYAVILQGAISNDNDNKDQDVQRRVYKLMAMIMFSRERLSITAMAMLGGFNDGKLQVDLVALSSVISLIGHIHFYHSLFLDYLCSDCR
jgi:hypothetical protein